MNKWKHAFSWSKFVWLYWQALLTIGNQCKENKCASLAVWRFTRDNIQSQIVRKTLSRKSVQLVTIFAMPLGSFFWASETKSYLLEWGWRKSWNCLPHSHLNNIFNWWLDLYLKGELILLFPFISNVRAYSLCISKVLSWNSRWCSPIGLIKYNIITSSMAQLISYFCISSQWACCSTFKYLASACCSSCSALQRPSTFPSSTCIDLLRDDSCMLHMGVIHIYVKCSSSILFLICSQQHFSDTGYLQLALLWFCLHSTMCRYEYINTVILQCTPTLFDCTFNTFF